MKNARAMATGGVLNEEVWGLGRSGQFYHLAERGPEIVSPLTPGGGETAAERRILADLRVPARPAPVVNVYPQRGQSEEQIAAAVSRRLAWAEAGGAP
jgi:hypothetical protein